mmetsp:Transcript_22565/g.47768  ORF Transcript_22565/g.47768 Transcript_22565/m.47768 type:complete len:234 (-) Transcript_22565:736-1437(-)
MCLRIIRCCCSCYTNCPPRQYRPLQIPCKTSLLPGACTRYDSPLPEAGATHLDRKRTTTTPCWIQHLGPVRRCPPPWRAHARTRPEPILGRVRGWMARATRPSRIDWRVSVCASCLGDSQCRRLCCPPFVCSSAGDHSLQSPTGDRRCRFPAICLGVVLHGRPSCRQEYRRERGSFSSSHSVDAAGLHRRCYRDRNPHRQHRHSSGGVRRRTASTCRVVFLPIPPLFRPLFPR